MVGKDERTDIKELTIGQAKLEVKVDNVVDDITEIKQGVTELVHLISGNGNPGINERLRNVEKANGINPSGVGDRLRGILPKTGSGSGIISLLVLIIYTILALTGVNLSMLPVDETSVTPMPIIETLLDTDIDKSKEIYDLT